MKKYRKNNVIRAFSIMGANKARAERVMKDNLFRYRLDWSNVFDPVRNAPNKNFIVKSAKDLECKNIQGFTLQPDMVCVFNRGEMIYVYRPAYWENSSSVGKLWTFENGEWKPEYISDFDLFCLFEYEGIDNIPMWQAWEQEKNEYGF